MNKVSQLAHTNLFSSVSPHEIQRIESMAISRSYPKNAFVTLMGDMWSYLLFVRSGEIQALKESLAGRSFIIETFGPREFFWGLSLFEDHKPNPVSIRASKDSQLLLWHKEQVEAIIATNTQVAWGLFQLLAEKMERVGKIVEELVFQPLTGRLANLLIDQFKGSEGNVITRDLTLDEMAARIGSTREMVCKILYSFADQGIIDIQRTVLKVNDRKQLELIANATKG